MIFFRFWSILEPKIPPKTAPRRSQAPPRRLQDAPKTSQDAPKTLQDVSRTPQDAPKTPQDSPGPSQDASWLDFGPHLDRFLMDFARFCNPTCLILASISLPFCMHFCFSSWLPDNTLATSLMVGAPVTPRKGSNIYIYI